MTETASPITTSHLLVECTYTEGLYHGVRTDARGRDTSDWPPAPGRLHQALLCAALAGLSPKLREADAGAALIALQWLENLDCPPIIYAPATLADARPRLQVALPHNNKRKKGTDILRHELQLAPLCRFTQWDTPGATPLRVCYIWDVSGVEADELRRHYESLVELAARVSYLGRAEDRVEIRVAVLDSLPALEPGCRRWEPAMHGDPRPVPRAGSVKELNARYAKPIAARTRKPDAVTCLRLQPYRRSDTLSAPVPVQTAIVRIYPDNGDPDARERAFDATAVHSWRAHVRHTLNRVFDRIRWSDHDLAKELVQGHRADGSRTEQPHLAILPLPSLNATGVADGLVRRFVLAGFARLQIAEQAAEIYRTLADNLDEEPLLQDQSPLGFLLRRDRTDPARDAIWSRCLEPNDRWATALPAALTRHFKVPKFTPDGSPLGSNERHLRRQREIAALIEKNLLNMGFPTAMVKNCRIEPAISPILAKTERADRYRSNSTRCYYTHVALAFDSPASGPIILGDLRYQGLGLCFPM